MDVLKSKGYAKHLLMIGFLLGLLVLLLIPINFGDYNSRLLDASWDLGHLAAFIGIIYAVYYFIPRFKTLTLGRQYLSMLVFVALLGMILEGGQILTGRMASLHDIFLDMVGGVIAVTLFSPAVANLKYRRVLWSLVSLLFLLSTNTLLAYLWDGHRLKQEFPLLGDFEKTIETSRWVSTGKISINREFSSKGQQSLKIIFDSGLFSGAKMTTLVADWQGYKYFAMDIYLPKTTPLKINLSVFSQQYIHIVANANFRFNKKINLQPGWNKIVLPLKDVRRSLAGDVNSISNIGSLMVYRMHAREPWVIYLDNIRLIKSTL